MSLRRMQEALRHRGPDGEGAFVDADVALAHTRLALVDRDGGAQPLRSIEGRYTLIVNGELYDHGRRLAALMERGARPTTRSDAELLLWTLALDGPAGLEKLEGEYAFCFWDARTRRALLGRDLLGVKPLVFATDDDGAFVFASEAKALQQGLAQPRAVDLDVLAQSFVCPPLSGRDDLPFRGVSSIPAGAVVEVIEGPDGAGRARPLMHRRYGPSAPSARHPAPAAASLLREALSAAVADRVDGDSDVGVLWSGGLDSTALVALSARPEQPRHSYTLRFDDDAVARGGGSIVVGDDAAVVAEHVGAQSTTHHWADASQGLLLGDVEALFSAQDRLVAWEQELSQRALARRAAADVKAVLVGDAADETHAGYAFALMAPAVSHPWAFAERFGGRRRVQLLSPMHRRALDAVVDDALAVAAAAGSTFGSTLRAQRQAMSDVVVQRWLPRLLHNGDLHTMAFGLEARVPFADGRVLAVAAAVDIDDAFVVDDGGLPPEKRVLRAALFGVVPEDILRRRKSALPRDERLGLAYRRRLRDALTAPRQREALAAVFDLDAVAALAGAGGGADDPVVDDDERALLFSVLAVDGFLRHHGGV